MTTLSLVAIERQVIISVPPFEDIVRVTLNGREVDTQVSPERPREFYTKSLFGLTMHTALSAGDVVEVEYTPTTDPVTSYYPHDNET